MENTTQQGVNHQREEFDATVTIQDLMDRYNIITGVAHL
jgi:hypothetical protein